MILKTSPMFNKNWQSSIATTKKFLSRQITHRLSRKLDTSKFEAVYDGVLDVFNPFGEEPDVVVYKKENGIQPVVAIEICKKEDLLEMSIYARQLMIQHKLKEFFFYDVDEDCWSRLDHHEELVPSCVSNELSIAFDDMVVLFPVRK